MEFKELIKARYSCKKYDGNQISTEQLQAILEAGRLAPTAKNLQEQHIYVLQSEEALAIIDEITPLILCLNVIRQTESIGVLLCLPHGSKLRFASLLH